MSNEMKEATAMSMNSSQSVAKTPKTQEFRDLLYDKSQTEAFKAILGDRTNAFQQTVMNVMLLPQNKALRECQPKSVLRAAMACAVTGLTIDPAFGQAAIVPFKDIATFMPMKNGLVKLARQSGLITDIRITRIYEGDVEYYDPLTGELLLNRERAMLRLKGEPKDLVCIGYYGVIIFKDGGKHTLFKSIEELTAHGQKYSKTFNRYDSLWKTNPAVMHEKTMIRQLILKEGAIDQYIDIRLGNALKFDMAVPDGDDITSAKPIYPDAGEAEEITYEEVQ